MKTTERITRLNSAAYQIIVNYARRRGVTSDGLNKYPQPNLRLGHGNLPQADKFIARLTTAVKNRDRILILGDYDADGVTATTITARLAQRVLGTRKTFERHEQITVLPPPPLLP